MSSTLDILKLQDGEAVKNTFYRSPKISPHVDNYTDHIEVKTIETTAEIYKLEEVILYIIADFKFSPFWLIQQWYEAFNRADSFTVVSNWISTGLVWVETSSMGVFIRPTKFLLDLMKVEDQFYIDIPFGLLNHTCGEEQLVFDIMMGNLKSEMWQIIKDEETLPCYHPLNIHPEKEDGTIILREASFKANRYQPQELLKQTQDLEREIKSGKNFTAEFNDFSEFPIVSFRESGEVVTQTPDVIVPIPRKDMKARSYAIEIELSAKTPEKYHQIMLNYKDNIKFGKVFYLCGNPRISRMVKDAYREVKGLGTCDLYLLPFIPPAMRLSNFNYQDEANQGNLIKTSIESNGE